MSREARDVLLHSRLAGGPAAGEIGECGTPSALSIIRSYKKAREFFQSVPTSWNPPTKTSVEKFSIVSLQADLPEYFNSEDGHPQKDDPTAKV